MLTKRKQCLAQRALRHEGSNEGKEFGMRKHGRSGDDSSMGGGGGCSNNHAPRATAAGNDELGGSERDGDGGDGGDVVRGGHGGVGTRLGGLGAADERGRISFHRSSVPASLSLRFPHPISGLRGPSVPFSKKLAGPDRGWSLKKKS